MASNLPHLQPFSRPGSELVTAAPVLDQPSLIAQIKDSNARFSRGAPRWAEQLLGAQTKPPDVLMCAVLDGDPDLPLAGVLALREPERIVAAVAHLAEMTGARRSWIVLDAALSDEWTGPLRRLARARKIRCISIRNDYPQSDPTLLLYTLLGRRLRPGELPTTQGVLLLDAAAAWRISGANLQTTPLGVRDLLRDRNYFLTVPVGTQIADVFSELDIPFADRLIRAGDPLRDIRIKPEAQIDGSEITLHLMRPERPINPDPCIRCGWCAEGCPVRIQPAGLLEAAQRANPAMARRFGLHACIECGICSYVCPSRLPLLDAIRSLR